MIAAMSGVLLLAALAEVRALALDLTGGVVVAPANLSRPEQKAVTMLVEEVEKRSHIRWEVMPTWPTDGVTAAIAPCLCRYRHW